MLVTVVITTLNRPLVVRRAIESVLAQTYEQVETIVVEDGSDVGIKTWLKENSYNNITYIRHQKNRGLAAARNTGLKLSNGQFIGYLDDDDEWKPKKLERQINRLSELRLDDNQKLGAIYCAAEVHMPNTDRSIINHPTNKGVLKESIIQHGAKTVSSSALFSKTALKKIGGFDENLTSSIDHDIWMSLAVNGYEVETLDEALVITYNRPTGRMTTDIVMRIQGVKMFTAKWQPTFEDWLGKKAGTAYIQRYFARVIGTLAKDRLIIGDLSGAKQAIGEIFKYNGVTLYNVTVIIKAMGIAASTKFLPGKIIDWLRPVKRILTW